MPRITKAEVRASVAEAKEKAAKKKTKEDFFRAQEAKKERPYPAQQEGTAIPISAQTEPADPDNKTNNKTITPDNKAKDTTFTKKVSISNLDITPIRPVSSGVTVVDSSRAKEVKEEVLSLREEVTNLEAINTQLQDELEKANEMLESCKDDSRELRINIDTLEESYKTKLSEAHEEYNSNLRNKNEETSKLKAQILVLKKEKEELLNKKPSKKEVISEKAVTIVAYLFFALFTGGILGLIGMLIFKGLSALGGWLF